MSGVDTDTGTDSGTEVGSGDVDTDSGVTSATDSDSDSGRVGCDNYVGEGFDLGMLSGDWSLQDVNGQTFTLSDFCGQAIFIEDTAGW